MDFFTKTNSLFSVNITIVAALLSLSGCSDRNHDLVEVSGTAIDSYLQGAVVCVDENKNKACDVGEPHSLTDVSGDFSLGTFSSAPILIIAEPENTKKSTTKGQAGEPITKAFFMTAPISAKAITPLTTLVQVGVEQGVYSSFSVGAADIISTLNIPNPSTVNLLDFDYIAVKEPAVAVIAEMLASSLADAIKKVASVVTDERATTSNVLSSAVMILIDPNIAGKPGTSLMEEIASAVEGLEVGDDISTINFDTVVSELEETMMDNGVGFADDLTDEEVDSIIVVVEDPEATGVTAEGG